MEYAIIITLVLIIALFIIIKKINRPTPIVQLIFFNRIWG